MVNFYDQRFNIGLANQQKQDLANFPRYNAAAARSGLRIDFSRPKMSAAKFALLVKIFCHPVVGASVPYPATLSQCSAKCSAPRSAVVKIV
jgi:hypothetical protein